MTPYAGFDMPVEYSGITDEHLAVRTHAGLFDVSHMGEIEIAGKEAVAAVQRISCNDASKLQQGHAQYSGLLTPSGTFVDDVVVYRLGPSHFMLVVNAANVAKDYAWITDQLKTMSDVAVVDTSSRYALIALQGPAAVETLRPIVTVDVEHVPYYGFTYGEVANARALISRTGYTGEDGFEIFVPPNTADRVWQALLESGSGAGVVPCGLGARDTLRLEAGMRLYGNDIDDTTTPVEAGLGWIVGWNKPAFIGADRLRQQKAQGPERRLVGFELTERGIARQGHSRGAGRHARRPRDQRHADAVPEEGRGHGLRACGHGGRGHPARHRHPRPRDPGRGGQAAVLQTSVRRAWSPEPGARSLTMSYPTDLRYTKDHEWVRLSGDVAEVGITDYAQQQLGDVVYVDLPAVGTKLDAGSAFGTIESVKAVSELFAPVSGAVTELNGALKDHPELRELGPAPDLDGPHQGERPVGGRRAARRRPGRSASPGTASVDDVLA